MSALGHKRTSDLVCIMSALPPKADIPRRRLEADILAAVGYDRKCAWNGAQARGASQLRFPVANS